MESISIDIIKLGMLRNAGKIKLNRLMIFSGESGLGKSYLAILCHYFFDILLDGKRLSSFLKEKGLDYANIAASYHGDKITFSFQKSELENWLAKDAISYLGYMINSDLSDSKIVVALPDSIESTINITYWEDVTKTSNGDEIYMYLKCPTITFSSQSNILHNEVLVPFYFSHYLIKSILGTPTALNNCFVFPPSRGPYLIEEVNPITGMGIKFKECLYKLKQPQRTQETLNNDTLQLFQTILNGEIHYRNGDYVYTVNGINLSLSASAASIRELAPIEQMIKKVNLGNTAILIEEPEAHLHPLKQRMMADITSSLMQAGAYMQITTHSDYYLRRMNELMMLYTLKDTADFKSLANKLSALPQLAIDNQKVSAYLLQRRKNGTAEIINQNLKNGIPYASFHDAIKANLKALTVLNELLEHYERN